MIVPVIFFVAAWTYAVAVNFAQNYRDPADKIRASEVGLAHEDVAEKSSYEKETITTV